MIQKYQNILALITRGKKERTINSNKRFWKVDARKSYQAIKVVTHLSAGWCVRVVMWLRESGFVATSQKVENVIGENDCVGGVRLCTVFPVNVLKLHHALGKWWTVLVKDSKNCVGGLPSTDVPLMDHGHNRADMSKLFWLKVGVKQEVGPF